MFFLAILGLTTLAIAGAAGYFSVYGLAQIFSGAFWSVVIMASTLEAGKLVAASYVYRYWTNITLAMKAYLISAIMILMLITSAGVFGFLTSSHMQGMSSLTESDTKIQLIEEQKVQSEKLKDERLSRRKQMDLEIANLPNDYVSGRQKLAKQYAPERAKIEKDIERYTADIEAKTKELADLQLGKLQEQAHVGPILYVAKALGKGVDDAVIWMTYLIMFAFDPLAVVLTIGFNIALKLRQDEKKVLEPIIPPDLPPPPKSKIIDDEPSPGITSVDQLPPSDVDDGSIEDPFVYVEEDEDTIEPEQVQEPIIVTEATPTPVPTRKMPQVKKGYSTR